MSDPITVGPEMPYIYGQYVEARNMRAAWEAKEKELRAELYTALGYDSTDAKPVAATAVTPLGMPLFRVGVSQRKGIDIGYLKDKYPQIYAECERFTPVKTIREA